MTFASRIASALGFGNVQRTKRLGVDYSNANSSIGYIADAFSYIPNTYRFDANDSLEHMVRSSIDAYARDAVATSAVNALQKNILDAKHPGGFHIIIPASIPTSIRQQVEQAWLRWMRSPIGIDGSSGDQMIRLALRTVLVEGSALVINIDGQYRIIGGFSMTQQGTTRRTNGGLVNNGIATNNNGKILGYHVDMSFRPPLSRDQPGGIQWQFLPSSPSVMHVFLDHMRIGNTGYPAIGKCLVEIKALDELIQSATVLVSSQQRNAYQIITDSAAVLNTGYDGEAMQAAGMEIPSLAKRSEDADKSAGEFTRNLRRGLGVKAVALPTGTKIDPIQPPINIMASEQLHAFLLNRIAQSIGITPHELTGLWQGLSFSSSNNALNESRSNSESMQRSIESRLIRPLFIDWFVRNYQQSFRLGAKVAQEIIMGTTFSGKQFYPADPTKSANANMIRLDSGVVSPQHIIRENGLNPDTIAQEIIEWREKVGVNDAKSTPDATPPAPDEDEDEDDDQEDDEDNT